MARRVIRALIDFFSHSTEFKPTISGSNSRLEIQLGDAAMNLNSNSPAHSGLKTASKIIEDTGEFVRLPMTWTKNMMNNWPIYLICGAIICLSILFLYCLIRRYLVRSSSSSSTVHQLMELATVMAHRPTSSIDKP